MLDKNPFQINTFRGINLGSSDENFSVYSNDDIPFEDALDALNISFLQEGGIRTRPGWATKLSFDPGAPDDGVCRMHWKISRLGSTNYINRWLILTWDDNGSPNVGRFYDTGGASPSVPILEIDDCEFASVLNIFGRLYISPLSAPGVPLTGSDGYIHLYDGTTARLAGGTRPVVGTLAVADTAVGGANVTAGLHLASIAYETDSGFITPPLTPATWIQVTITAGGGRAARFTNVPLGPTGTVARHLLLSKVISNYDGIPENWELFFGLRIGDNTTTTGDIVVPDTGLVDSADYLLDEFESLPACAAITMFNGRMVYNGGNVDRRVAYVSKVADPETIDQTEDYIQINVGIPDEILNGRELRGIYYIFKETSTWVTNDNGGPPNSWEVNIVDSGLGLQPFGVAEVMANPGSLILDNLLVAGLNGIYIFSGAFSPEPLSKKIQSLFTESDRQQLQYIRLAVDPNRKQLFFHFGDPDACMEMWVGDYTDGLDPDNIKWCRWIAGQETEASVAEPGVIRSIVVDPNNGDQNLPVTTVVTHVADFSVNILETDYGNLIDEVGNTTPAEINGFYITGFTSNNLGEDYTFAALICRLLQKTDGTPGRNTVIQFLLGQMDESGPEAQGEIDTPGHEAKRFFNIPLDKVAQKVYCKINWYNLVQISRLSLMVSEREKLRSRP